MPRRGGPSQGCAACREAKKKCDEKQPTCGRCFLRDLRCSGPPDFFQTRLRDETPKYRRLQQAPRVDKESHGPLNLLPSEARLTMKINTSAEFSNDASTGVQRIGSIRAPLKTAAEVCAETFLFHACEAVSYIVPYPGWGPFIRYLPKLSATSHNDSPLQTAIRAVAFCITSLQPGFSKDASSYASRFYSAALVRTNAAIADPEASRSDETLMTTLLLSVYECYRPSVGSKTRGLYRSHLDGAIALLRHRGLSQFNDTISKELFRAVRAQMVNLYAHRKESIPVFANMKGWNLDPDDDHDALSLLTKAALDLPGLREKADQLFHLREPSAIVRTSHELILQSEKVDTALLLWLDSFVATSGPLVSYQPKDHSDSLCWSKQLVHEYPNLFVASTLNTYRVYRIYTHQARLRALKALDQIQELTAFSMEHDPEPAAISVQILRGMCDEICASIPYHLKNESVPLSVGEGFISSALITASFVDELPWQQKYGIERLLYNIAFSERERVGPCLIWDARIMTRMGKFTNIPSALKSNPELA